MHFFFQDLNKKMVTNDKNMFVTGRNHFTIIAKIMLSSHDFSDWNMKYKIFN